MYADKSLHVFLFCGQPSAGPLPPATALHNPSAPHLPLPPPVAKAGNGIPRAGVAHAGGLGSLSNPSWYCVEAVGPALVLI